LPGVSALRVVFVLAAVLAAGLAAPAYAQRQALETILQDDAELLHGTDEEVRAAIAQLREFGVDRIRLTAGWSVLTRDADVKQRPQFDAADPAAYEQVRWAGLDRAVRLAAEQGIAVMIDVAFWAPLWATEDTEPSRARTRPDPHAYADFAVAVARRYDGSFVPPAPEPGEVVEPSEDASFLDSIFEPVPGTRQQTVPSTAAPPVDLGPLPRVDVVSLWNEPNHQAFLAPLWDKRPGRRARPVAPTVYRAMVHAAYPAIKAVRPDLKVLVGATSSVGDHTGRGKSGIPLLLFIRDLACVSRRLRPLRRGSCRSFAPIPGDGWTHHPYSLDSPPDRPSPRWARDNAKMGDLRKLTRLLDRLVRRGRLAPALRGVWLTEYGYESRTYPGRPVFGLDEQAVFLTWAEYLAWRNPRVKTYAQFLLRDLPYAGPANPVRRPQGHWESGLLFADGRPKPMATSFRVGLHAERLRRRRTELWGRVRGIAPGAVATVQRRVGRRGRWRAVANGPIGGRQVLVRRVRSVRRARYRMLVRAGDRTLASFVVRAR
jgi:hypothetical protein